MPFASREKFGFYIGKLYFVFKYILIIHNNLNFLSLAFKSVIPLSLSSIDSLWKFSWHVMLKLPSLALWYPYLPVSFQFRICMVCVKGYDCGSLLPYSYIPFPFQLVLHLICLLPFGTFGMSKYTRSCLFLCPM